MDAKLCRLIARAQTSPYFRLEGRYLPMVMGEEGDRPVQDWLVEQGLKATTFNRLPELLQGFLKLCDRSIEVEYELFKGKIAGTQQEMDAKIMARLEELGDIEVEVG